MFSSARSSAVIAIVSGASLASATLPPFEPSAAEIQQPGAGSLVHPKSEPVTVTKEQIATQIEEAWGGVSDFQITSKFVLLNRTPEDQSYDGEHKISFGDRRQIISNEIVLTGTVEGLGRRFSRAILFDGNEQRTYNANNGAILIQSELTQQAILEITGMFPNLNPHLRLPIKGRSDLDSSLCALMKSDWSVLQPTFENVDGVPCVVVVSSRANVCLIPKADGSLPSKAEMPEGTEFFNDQKYWLDPNRGYLPIRQEHYLGDGKLLSRITVNDAVQVAPAIWVATDASQYTPALPPDLPKETGMHLFVPKDSDGRYLVSAGKPVILPESPLKHLNLPPGMPRMEMGKPKAKEAPSPEAR